MRCAVKLAAFSIAVGKPVCQSLITMSPFVTGNPRAALSGTTEMSLVPMAAMPHCASIMADGITSSVR